MRPCPPRHFLRRAPRLLPMVCLVVWCAVAVSPAVLLPAGRGLAASGGELRLACFDVDATPPVGGQMAYGEALRAADLQLRCRGLVLTGAGDPIVLCAVDWLGIGNAAHDAFREGLAAAAGTTPDRVAVHTLHQHDAPHVDFTAEAIARRLGVAAKYPNIDGTFARAVLERAASAIRAALPQARPVTHYGFGRAKVQEVASNRRIVDGFGKVTGWRGSATKDPDLRALPEGTIDPYVTALVLWSNEDPLAVLTAYACHPQSYYRTGVPSPDFPGIARFIRTQDLPTALHVHFAGAGGNVAAGKYNDGNTANRVPLATRLAAGMRQAFSAAERKPLGAADVGWTTEPLALRARDQLDEDALLAATRSGSARGPLDPVEPLAWIEWLRDGHKVTASCLQIGDVRMLHLPGELFVEYQLEAQAMRPDLGVMVAAYGNYGPAYIGTAAAYRGGGYETELRTSFVGPDAEQEIFRGVRKLLQMSPAAGADDLTAETLPRIPPREPAEALRSFTVAPGFSIELAAAEPLLHSPVAVDFDERGRMFVVGMIDYSEQAKEHLGEVRILEDADGDGRYETSRVFAAGLSWPTGVLCYDGGAFVCAAPDLLYLKDTDGDGVADERRVVFTGFSRTNVQGLFNSLRWGLDNRIHGATSSSKSVRISRPDDPAFEPRSLSGRDFSFDPRQLDLRAESGNLQHGMSFDDWGRKFVSGNSNPLEMALYEDRYAARNPFMKPPPSRASIAVDGGADEVFRTSPVEPWRILRTKMRMANPALGAVEGGGRAAGYFTGATGVTAYRGDAYPADMRDCLIVGDVGSNLVHRERLTADGVLLAAHRIDERSEFLCSDDIWFRPVQFANAPDGTLYVIDMYREVIENPVSFPPEIKRQLDLTSGQERGRIWRVKPADWNPRGQTDLAAATTAELVDLLGHRNGWHRDTAARLLYERQDPAAVGPLERLSRDCPLPEGRMHALYVLDGLGRLEAGVVRAALADAHARVREHAVRLAERHASDAATLTRLVTLADDVNPRVRYQLAFSLGESPSGPQRDAALARLASRDGASVYPRAAVLSSLVNGAGAVFEILAADPAGRESGGGGDLLEPLARQIGRQLRPEDVRRLEATLAGPIDPASETGSLVMAAYLAGRAKAPADARSRVPLSPALTAARQKLLETARRVAIDDNASTIERVQAVGRLALGSFTESADDFEVLLESRQPQEVQQAAIDALDVLGEPGTGDWYLDRWPQFSPRLRTLVGQRLLSRGPWIMAVFAAIEVGRVKLADFDPAQIRLLESRSEPEIRDRYAKIAQQVSISPRQDVLDAYKHALDLAGDCDRGREHFRRVCAQCHRVGDVGYQIGPSLVAFKNRGAEAILWNVLDPNLEINPAYVNYVALLTDGRTVTGMISEETATSITLRRAEGHTDTVPRSEIESLVSTRQSIMPEGLEKQLDPQALADVIAFLMAHP